jgi:4-amino-4-deoxy-L-arabinose transferase-like glycosyltransferase
MKTAGPATPNPQSAIRNPQSRDLLLLLGLCFLCFFFRLGAVGLHDFNEGFYVQAAREIYLRGDFVTPRVNGIYFFDKPPLALWLTALSFHALGVNEFAARFPVAVAATLLVVLTYLFGERFFGRKTALLAGCMLALSPMMVGTARQMTMDIHQSLWFAVALYAFFLAYTAQTKKGKRWYYAFWASCGLAFLAKSVPGLMPIFVALVFVCFAERFQIRAVLRRIWESKPIPGILLLLAVILPWHVLAYHANGAVFYEEYWILHHVGLLRGTEFDHAQPVWYYIPMLLAGFFPWSVFLVPALLHTRVTLRSQVPDVPERTALLFVVVWAVTIFLIFTIMKSKLISYLLPMYSAAALLTAHYLVHTMETSEAKSGRWLKAGTTLVGLLTVAAFVFAQIMVRLAAHRPRLAADLAREFPAPMMSWLMQTLLVVAALSGLAAFLQWTGRRSQGVWALVGAMTLFVAMTVTQGQAAIEETKNGPLQSLAREAGDKMRAGTPVAIHIGRPRYPSVFFYLPASAYLDKPLPADPKADGLILERGDEEPIVQFLAQNRPAYVLTDIKRAEALQRDVPGLVVEKQNRRWALVRAEAGPARPVEQATNSGSPL